MGLSERGRTKQLSKDLLPGVPVGRKWLAERAISPQLAYRYVQTGWLERVARGVFAKPGAPLDVEPSLRLLVETGCRVHVGGKSALAWQGHRHNLSLGGEALTLYRRKGRPLPGWFVTRFRPETDSRQLFAEEAGQPAFVSEHPDHPGVPVSEPERAVLELLSGVPARQGVEEAAQLVEGLVALRPAALQDLLSRCRSRKTVRLFLHFARASSLPVLDRLAPEHLPAGSSSRYVLKLPGRTLALKR